MGVQNAAGTDCTCPNDTHFAVDKACGSTAACKAGYITKGTCKTKCADD